VVLDRDVLGASHRGRHAVMTHTDMVEAIYGRATPPNSCTAPG